jgi:dipeptidyl aminopeptidase/acylaminoacyl peptidase
MKYQSLTTHVRTNTFLLLVIIFLSICVVSMAGEVLSPEDILKIRTVGNAQISPDGKWIAYTLGVPRTADEKPGGYYSELYLVSTNTDEVRPFITGKVNVSSPQWSPDGSQIAFLTQRGGQNKTQVWAIPLLGGEAIQITRSQTSVSSYRWHPTEKLIAYIASTPKSKQEMDLAQKGYGFIFYEENLKHRNLYLSKADCNCGSCSCKDEQLTKDLTVWSFEFSPDGKTIAAAITKKNLIDHRYMFQKIHLLDLETKELKQLTENPGKLGNYAFSPDGTRLAYAAALELKDHAVSQAFVIDTQSGQVRNLTPADFKGHIHWIGWKDNQTICYRCSEGVWPTLSTVKVTGGKREVLLHAKKSGIIFNTPSYTKNFKHFAFSGSTPTDPGDIYYWKKGKFLKRMTNIDKWIDERKLGVQSVMKFKARDDREIEGILIDPVDTQGGAPHPLIVIVHGGPESHYSNGWMTGYSTPGQVLAGKGYRVFYPNYRSSTGYGLEYALTGYEDAAGVEFNDIADGIEALIKSGKADSQRIGLGGGSYGGYASAWFSSYYTRYVKAVCMFVGISDLISKRGTTDIPYEELYVHSGQKLEKMWEESLKRSPIYWAHQSKTAVLIMGGNADTRVHPSQSLEYYRRLKMNDHPAVRLVQYPGEGHGNRRQPGRIDVLYRIIDWYDWYVKDKKPLDGPMPTLDISDKYGLDL